MIDKFPIRPIGDKVVVLPDKAPDRTSAGLYLPGTVSTQTKTGVVQAVGEGRFTVKGTIPIALKPGDHVFYGEFAGVELKLGSNTTYLIMREEEVMGIITQGAIPTNDPNIFAKKTESIEKGIA